jgi:hypothetical protein
METIISLQVCGLALHPGASSSVLPQQDHMLMVE